MYPVLLEITTTSALLILGIAVPGWLLWQMAGELRRGELKRSELGRTVVRIIVSSAIVVGAVGYVFSRMDQALPLHTYGVMIALGFLAGLYVAIREGRRTGLDTEHMQDLAFWLLLAGLAGSRVLFIIVNPDQYFGANFLGNVDLLGRELRLPNILLFWRGGLVFYGGFIGAFLTAVWYFRKHGLDFWRYADAIIPVVALGHFFGRLGCFSAGCCWGKTCAPDSAFATFFPKGSLAFSQTGTETHIQHLGEWTTAAVYPTQLFESLGTLTIFALLLFIRSRKRFHGQVVIGYFILYPIFRTVNEVFRGDWGRGMVFSFPASDPVMLSTSQTISLLVALVGIAFTVYRVRSLRVNARRVSAVVGEGRTAPDA